MKKISLSFAIVLVLFLFSNRINAQTNYADVDSNTYKLYQLQQWSTLIEYGEKAIEDGVDYMFLRQRIGVAYFSLLDYRMATYHLEKALTFNCDDNFTLYYLYFSYLYSGRTSDANFITKNMTSIVKGNVFWKQKYLSAITIESGKTFSNNITKNNSINYAETYNLYGENTMNGNLKYYHLGLNHEVLPGISFYHGFSKIDIESQKIIMYNDSFNRAVKGLKVSIDNYTLNQYEYYINSDIQLTHGLKLTPAFHYLHVGFSNIKYDTTKNIGIVTTQTTLNNYVASLAIAKDYKYIGLGLFATYSNLNNLNQLIFGGILNYFPNGNLDQYFTTTISYIKEKNNVNGTPTRWVFDQLAGTKLFSKLWGEASVTFGDLTNFNEKNALIVFNTADNIKFKAGASLLYMLNSHLELSLRYQFQTRDNNYLKYTSATTITYTQTNYINNSILGGIKWKL